jgi:hypothetical protein
MLFGFDLNHLFYFPVENKDARKNFLLGALVTLAGFVIPIIPHIFVIGYLARIMRQVINGEKPHMPAWDDWETMFKDGAKLFGVRFIYTLPFLMVMIPVMAMFIISPILAETMRDSAVFFYTLPFIFMLFMLCLMPFSFALMIILPAAELHVVATSEFSAGFRIGEWWAIFRKNIGGFVVAFMIFYGLSMVMSFAFQILIMTIILICLLPLILPAYSLYMSTLMYTTFAQAYREGQAKLNPQTASPEIVTVTEA